MGKQSISHRLTAKQEQKFSPKATPLNSYLVASHSFFGEPARHHHEELCKQSSDGFRRLTGPRTSSLWATGSNLLVVRLGIYSGTGIWLYYIITAPVKAVKNLPKAAAGKKTNHGEGETALLWDIQASGCPYFGVTPWGPSGQKRPRKVHPCLGLLQNHRMV